MFKRNHLTAVLALVVGVALMATSAANAGIFTLTDANSTATIDTTSQDGISDWVVDSVDHSYQQWFWYRIGATGPESSIDTLGIVTEGTSDTNFDGFDETLYTKLADGATQVEITYILTGGVAGSGNSDIAEVVEIKNTSGETQDYSFFQYVDFDLGLSVSDDYVQVMNPNTVKQWDDSVVITESVVTPSPAHHEVDVFSNTRDHLNDAFTSTLNDFGGVLGPNDVTWAFQWDFTLADGQSFLISKDKNMQIPAPGALLLAALGFPMIGWVRRKFS